MGERRAVSESFVHFMQSYIHYIFTVNAPILYLFCNKSYKKQQMLFNLIIKKDISSD